MFRHALEVGKRARTETGISRHIASVSTAAVAMAAQRLGSLEGRSILVLGAGDMGEGMVRVAGRAPGSTTCASPTAPGIGPSSWPTAWAAGPWAWPTWTRRWPRSTCC